MSRGIRFQPPRKWKRDRLIKDSKKLLKFEADRAYPPPVNDKPKKESE